MPSPPGLDVQSHIASLRDATTRLEAAIAGCIESGGSEAFAAPSRLPKWTVGHVVTHLARNSDGLRRVLVGAKVGEQLQPYASPQARVDDIETGALRSTETIAMDFRTATEQLSETIETLPPAVWSGTVDLGRGGPTTADVILAARLAEVELHHHDLGVDLELDRVARKRHCAGESVPVEAPVHAVELAAGADANALLAAERVGQAAFNGCVEHALSIGTLR